MKHVRLIALTILVILVVGIWISCWKRYPTKEEVEAGVSLRSDEGVTIDTDQSEMGLYWITIEGSDGSQREYGMEVLQQWTFPWQQYDFNKN